jgi:hypothetical protein
LGIDPTIQKFAQISLMRHQARQKEVEAQFGLGRPPISAELNGYQFVAVGPELHYSKTWKTFPDFLMGYFKTVMGAEWGKRNSPSLATDGIPCSPGTQWLASTRRKPSRPPDSRLRRR